MSSKWKGFLRDFCTVSVIAALQACGGGGGSNVGDQSEAEPVAVAQVLGVSTVTTGEVVTRSGSEVLLSAKESDGIDDPILYFEWRQVDNSGKPVELIERASNARSFTAPAVATNTDLQFELKVTDSDGKTATDRITVQVQPAADANVFLVQDAQSDVSRDSYDFIVAVEPGETTNSRFTLRIDTIVQWLDRNGVQREQVMSSERIEGEWPTGVTGTGEFDQAYFNPRYSRRLPILDIDEVNKFFEAEADRDKRIELAAVDDANVFVNFVLEDFDNNARIVLEREDGEFEQLLATVDGAVETGNIPVDRLRAAGGLDTRESAQKYYALIDAPETLSQWLDMAGFGPDPANQPDVAHARYVNNFDLGFGREMYQRVDECGNVYSFVNNYPTLEATIQPRAKFATVVMEYAPIDRTCAGEKIVKFLAYVPDEVTGEDVLVTSMNFDGRGERVVPGVCTVCHGGAPTNLSDISLDQIAGLDDVTRTQHADLSSSFMLWDLDAFLYSDTDPALTQDRDKISDSLRQRYTRAAQEAEFRALNQGALATYQGDPDRYAASIKLVHGWYGAYDSDSTCGEDGTEAMPATPDVLPDGAFDGSYVQCGWRSEHALYESVFARNCRMCHTQLVNQSLNFDTSEEFLGSPSLATRVYEDGVMPLARLTYDRFWADFDGGESGASLLAKRLPVAPSLPLALPIPEIRFVAVDPATGASSQAPDLGDAVFLDGSSSSFADSFQWSIATANGCGDEPLLVASTSATANFLVGQAKCDYEVTLSAANGTGSAETKLLIASPNPRPVAVDFVAPLDDFTPGASQLLIDVLARITEVGDGSLKVIVNNADAPFNLAINNNVVNNDNGTLSYLLGNSPFGVLDEVEYQLQDVDGSLSPEKGRISVVIDPVVPVVNADAFATAIKLLWTFGGSADGFNIYRCVGAGCTIAGDAPVYAQVAGGGTREFTDSPLPTGQTFTYQVSAVKGGLESGKSAPPLSIVTADNAITGFIANATFPTVALQWNALAGATSYTVQRDGADYATNLAATNFVDSQVDPGASYTYRIVGFAPGNNLLGNSTSRAVIAAGVPDPGSVSVQPGKGGNCTDPNWVTASWDAVTDVESYNLYIENVLVGATAASTLQVDVGDSNKPVSVEVKSVYRGVESSGGTTGDGISCVSYLHDLYESGNVSGRIGWQDKGCDGGGCHQSGDPSPDLPAPPLIVDPVSDRQAVYDAVISRKTGDNRNIYCMTQSTRSDDTACVNSTMQGSFWDNATEVDLIKRWLEQGADNN